MTNESRLCDWRNPQIIEKVQEIVAGVSVDEEKARRISLWIKKNTAYHLGSGAYWDTPASETLRTKSIEPDRSKIKAMCFNVTNLQVAMLRAVGVLARFAVIKQRRETVKRLIPVWRYEKMNETTEHIFGEVFIQGNWHRFDILRDTDFDTPDGWAKFDLLDTRYSAELLDELAMEKAKKDTHQERDEIDDHFRLF